MPNETNDVQAVNETPAAPTADTAAAKPDAQENAALDAAQQSESSEGYVVNPEKNETIEVDGVQYRRLCIKTHVITDKDNIVDVVEKYAAPLVQDGDIVFITEKAVACTQRRAIPLEDIHPRPLARFLSKFVLRTPYGIGLAMPETMECALRECGTIRILFAAAVSAVGKLFGIRGWFYNIAGYRARSIDGPCEFTLPPYNHYVVLGPDRPDGVASDISQRLGGTQVGGADPGHLRQTDGPRTALQNPQGQPARPVQRTDTNGHHPARLVRWIHTVGNFFFIENIL